MTMMKVKSVSRVVLLCGMGALAFISPAQSKSIQANFSGRLIDIPCKFNHSGDLDFDFKEVVAQNIDNNDQSVEKNVSVTCDSNSPSQLLTLRISGTQLAGAATNIADSGLPDMGIVLTNADNGNAINLGDAITDASVDNQLSLNLKATLMNNKPGTTLSTGDFSTELTLSVKYE